MLFEREAAYVHEIAMLFSLDTLQYRASQLSSLQFCFLVLSKPTKEFGAKDVGAGLAFEAFSQYAVGITFPGLDPSEIERAAFKYQIDEMPTRGQYT